MIDNLIKFATLHRALGYTLRKGFDDCGRFQFIGGEWRFRVNMRQPWAKVGSEWNLHLQLQAWDDAEDCSVLFWQCGWCKTPESNALCAKITEAGGKVTHGICDACAKRDFPELLLEMAA